MARKIHKANTPPSEATEIRAASASDTGALNGEHESEAARQSNRQPAVADEETIRARAYSKWEAAGCPTGDGVDFWLQAEREVGAEPLGSTSAQ